MRISDWSSDVCSSDLVAGSRDRRAFVDLPFRLYAGDPNWVPPLKSEVAGLISPKSNPWFEHARAAFFLAERDGRIVGRISAQVDDLVQVHMGHGTGQWGMFESEDAEVADARSRAASSAERRVGKECGRTYRSRRQRHH